MPKPREHLKGGSRDSVRARGQGKCYEVLSSGHDLAIALVTSLNLWSLAQDLVNISHCSSTQHQMDRKDNQIKEDMKEEDVLGIGSWGGGKNRGMEWI